MLPYIAYMDPMGMLKKFRVKKSCFFYGDINLLYDLKIKPQNYSKYGGIFLREQEMLLSLLPKKLMVLMLIAASLFFMIDID